MRSKTLTDNVKVENANFPLAPLIFDRAGTINFVQAVKNSEVKVSIAKRG